MNEGSRSADRNLRMIAVVRAVHALLALVFIGAIAIIYRSGISGTLNVWFYLATAMIVFEGIVISMNRGNCPFLHLHRRYGDDKRLFELFLPWRFAKYALALLLVVIAGGYALVLINLD